MCAFYINCTSIFKKEDCWGKPLYIQYICWSWSSNTLVTWCKQLTHWKRPWCWERLKAEGEEGDRGQDGWMTSPIQWAWNWAHSGRWWRTGRPGFKESGLTWQLHTHTSLTHTHTHTHTHPSTAQIHVHTYTHTHACPVAQTVKVSKSQTWLDDCTDICTRVHTHTHTHTYFPGGSDSKESVYNAGDPGSIPRSGRSPEKGIDYLHSSILSWRIPWTEEPGRL